MFTFTFRHNIFEDLLKTTLNPLLKGIRLIWSWHLCGRYLDTHTSHINVSVDQTDPTMTPINKAGLPQYNNVPRHTPKTSQERLKEQNQRTSPAHGGLTFLVA